MDNFLDSVRATGEHDSEGHFTISLERSAWKLGAYRLADAGEYPIHLLACAVASGATRFTVHRTLSYTHIGFNGKAFTPEEMATLDGTADLDQKDPRLAYLELAIVTAGRRTKVRFSTPGPGKRLELLLTGGEVFHSAAESSVNRETSLTVEERLNDEDFKEFLRRCRFAPLTIVDGTKPVSKNYPELDLEHNERNWLLQGTQRFKFADDFGNKYRNRTVTGQSGLEPSLLLCLNLDKKRGSFLLSHGVVIETKRRFFDCPLLSGVVSANHLKKDLSGKAFLRNKAFEDFRAELIELAKSQLVEFCQTPPMLSSEQQKVLLEELTVLFPTEQRPSAVETFLKTLEERLKLSDLKPTRSILELGRLASAALESHSWGLYGAMEEKIERKVTYEWSSGSWSAARSWLKALLYFQQAGERDASQTEARYAYSSFMSRNDDYQDWARRIFEDANSSRNSRFRAFLMLAPEMDRGGLQRHVDSLVTAPHWRAPFHFLRDSGLQRLYAVPPRVVEYWEFARLLCHGNSSGVFRYLKRVLKERESPLEQEIWYEVLHRSRRGSLSYPEQIGLRVARARLMLTTTKVGLHEFEAFLEKGPSRTRQASMSSWFHSLPKLPLFRFPALVYQLYLISHLDYEVRARYLCRRLLASTFQASDQSCDFTEPLPVEWLGFEA